MTDNILDLIADDNVSVEDLDTTATEQERNIFIGVHNIKIDSKSRIVLPSEFSKRLVAKQDLILTKAFNSGYPILAIFPNTEIFETKLYNYDFIGDLSEDDKRNYWRMNTMVGNVGNTFKVTIKESQKDFIPENRLITLLGCGSWFECWRRDDFNEYRSKLPEQYPNVFKSLRK